ncbi:dUTP diphosphatase [Viridibacillus arvi]|uniref:dUTP diphosphatase n=1 Tax=Viridibacillus arvi TaxID=263475 RepID=UPI003D266D08
MNLTKLFEAQRELDDYIEQQHPTAPGEDRLSKKILALLVELGECANEWRGFKFWSNDQRPRIELFVDCRVCQGYGDANYEMIQEDAEGIGQHEYIECVDCEGSGSEGPKNPLLEEYVDCLHFALSIWNENPPCTVTEMQAIMKGILEKEEAKNVIYVFSDLFNELSFYEKGNLGVIGVLEKLAELSKALGFTWDQIEQAYWEKYEINKQRQQNGY